MPSVPDDPERSNDTDPLADTQARGADEPSEADKARSPQRRSVRSGDTLGRYELIEDVGEGGMATVYRARDKELRRDVAVKVLFPHLARRDEVVRRFHREARAAAGLEHPNILRVYDVGGEGDDPPYIVMELVKGRSLLGELEQHGPMLAEVAACIGALLADALAVAHAAGIIHRDIKPANILLDGKGRVLLADFGVARLETEDSLVTKTGALLGTPAYMSPEQASGDTATAKSDLYSLGATLYQIATGHLPYAGSPAKVLAQIAQGAMVPAARKRPAVGLELSKLIDRLMAPDPEARPANAASIAAELRQIATAGGLGDPADEVAAYFADREAFAKKKIPGVVASLVTGANQAIADGKLPRAMALADRASALAPDDPAVATLVDRITEGGRASRRRTIAAIAGIGVLVAGGATFGIAELVSRKAPVVAPTEPVAPDAAAVALIVADAAAEPALPDAGAPRTDARDAGVVPVVRRRDAGVVVVTVPPDAAVRADAAVTVAVAAPDAGVPQQGFVIVKADAWCVVTIDAQDRGRNTSKAIAIAAGSHTVTCAQPGVGGSFTKRVDVHAGETAVVEGSVLGTVSVTLDVDASIDSKPYRKGDVVRLEASRHQFDVGGKNIWITLRRACHVRTTPEPGCF